MSFFKKIFKGEPHEEEKQTTSQGIEIKPEYAGNICTVCGEPGADKKFAGQWFHKKCLRKARKMAKGMM